MMDRVILEPGWEGFPDIVLADGEYSLRGRETVTDLLLHFNGHGSDYDSPSYPVEETADESMNLNYSFRQKVLGAAALALQPGNSPVTILPRR